MWRWTVVPEETVPERHDVVEGEAKVNHLCGIHTNQDEEGEAKGCGSNGRVDKSGSLQGRSERCCLKQS